MSSIATLARRGNRWIIIVNDPSVDYLVESEELDYWQARDRASRINADWRAEQAAAAPTAASIGAKGGRSTSDAKRAAAAANGRKGGRPKRTE